MLAPRNASPGTVALMLVGLGVLLSDARYRHGVLFLLGMVLATSAALWVIVLVMEWFEERALRRKRDGAPGKGS